MLVISKTGKLGSWEVMQFRGNGRYMASWEFPRWRDALPFIESKLPDIQEVASDPRSSESLPAVESISVRYRPNVKDTPWIIDVDFPHSYRIRETFTAKSQEETLHLIKTILIRLGVN